MKKYLKLIVLLVVIACAKIGTATYFGINRDNAQTLLSSTRASYLKLETDLKLYDSIGDYEKADKTRQDISLTYCELFKYYEDVCFYRKLNNISTWVFSFLAVVSLLFCLYSQRKNKDAEKTVCNTNI